MAVKIKVSRRREDVKRAGSQGVTFDSSEEILQVSKSGYVTQQVSGGQSGTLTVYHNLGFVPITDIICEFDSGDTSHIPSYGGMANAYFDIYSDRLQIVGRVSGTVAQTFRYSYWIFSKQV